MPRISRASHPGRGARGAASQHPGRTTRTVSAKQSARDFTLDAHRAAPRGGKAANLPSHAASRALPLPRLFASEAGGFISYDGVFQARIVSRAVTDGQRKKGARVVIFGRFVD